MGIDFSHGRHRRAHRRHLVAAFSATIQVCCELPPAAEAEEPGASAASSGKTGAAS